MEEASVQALTPRSEAGPPGGRTASPLRSPFVRNLDTSDPSPEVLLPMTTELGRPRPCLRWMRFSGFDLAAVERMSGRQIIRSDGPWLRAKQGGNKCWI